MPKLNHSRAFLLLIILIFLQNLVRPWSRSLCVTLPLYKELLQLFFRWKGFKSELYMSLKESFGFVWSWATAFVKAESKLQFGLVSKFSGYNPFKNKYKSAQRPLAFMVSWWNWNNEKNESTRMKPSFDIPTHHSLVSSPSQIVHVSHKWLPRIPQLNVDIISYRAHILYC